ncbi:MAG: hypothetical protein AB7K04_06495 [Pseudorhodoplanes sp.]
MTPRHVIVPPLTLAGFGLTCLVFYPGVETFDARYVYLAIKGGAGDWQSPVMTALWGLIDPLAPGATSMFLLIAAGYWLGFGILALALARDALWPALLLLALAASPPAFVLSGVIWRDVLFAVSWLLAAALAFSVASAPSRTPWLALVPALILVCFGVLLRPNALVAAPLLLLYVLDPAQVRVKRILLASVPLMIGCYGLVQATYYNVLHAKREYPLHSLLVYDLGGITHFTRQNQFPVEWTPEQTALLTDACYKPTYWDIYWIHEPCKFVMTRLERADDKVFGTSRLPEAWLKAVAAHPIAYLMHRGAFLWQLMARQNLVLWVVDVDNPKEIANRDRPAFMAFKALHDRLLDTYIFRAGWWVLICAGLAAAAWWKRETVQGAFVFHVCGSAFAYAASYFVFGVASDYRYTYWCVLAAMAGGAVFASSRASRA